MPLTYKLSFTYIYIHVYSFCYSVFVLHRIHTIFCVMLLTQILELQHAKDAKTSHFLMSDLRSLVIVVVVVVLFFPPFY